MTSQPSSSQENAGSHGITIQVDAVALEKMRKEGTTDDGFTLYCDVMADFLDD